MAKPTLFIGSSSSEEGLDVAYAIEKNLANDAEVTIWKNGVFASHFGYLETLVNAVEKFDFAVLVLAPDDLVAGTDEVSIAPRDNVMFELGLFMGRLGRHRTFAVRSDAPELKIPTDLAGVALEKYASQRSDGNWDAAVSPACTTIRRAVRDLGVAEHRTVARLADATTNFEGVSQRVERIIYLMAQSRILELEVIRNSFGSLMDQEFADRLIKDIEFLKDEASCRLPESGVE